jgi:hypothetical protein
MGEQLVSAVTLVQVTLAMKLIEDGSRDLKVNDKNAIVLQQKKEVAHQLRRTVETWESFQEEAIRESVMDWRMKHKSIWNDLMNRE